MSTIFNTYVTPQIKEINHPEFLQEWKLNIDAAEYEKNMKTNMYKLSEKRNLIVLIITNTGQHQKIDNSVLSFSYHYGIYCK